MEHTNESHEVKKAINNLSSTSINDTLIISGSILVAAILISGSIFYNTKVFLQNIKNFSTALPVAQQGNNQNNNQVPTAPPTGPVEVEIRSDAPALGKNSAKVTIIEFADFQCPFCKKYFTETFNQIKKKYIDTGKVKYVFRHFPLAFHNNAEISAVASECANRQGKFWEYHDRLFEQGEGDGKNLDKESLIKLADEMGLNKGTLGFTKNKFNNCLEDKSILEIVKIDNAVGAKAGVSGTPTFYINGIQLVGAQPFSEFEKKIDAELKK